MTTTTQTPNHLTTIVIRQRKNRVLDLLFAAGIALAAAVSLATLSTASHAASTSQVAHR